MNYLALQNLAFELQPYARRRYGVMPLIDKKLVTRASRRRPMATKNKKGFESVAMFGLKVAAAGVAVYSVVLGVALLGL